MADVKSALLRAHEVIGKRLFGVGKDPDWYALFQKYGTNRQQTTLLQTYKNIVQACISTIATDVAGYEPVLKKRMGDGSLEAVTQHSFLDLIENPQPNDTGGISKFELIEATQSFKELQGECFWYIPAGDFSGTPIGIYILRPDKVGIDIDDKGNINGYYYRLNSGTPIPFTPDEILHFKEFNPHNPYRGFGTVQAAIDYIELDDHTTNFTRRFFENNAGMNGVLSLKGEVTKNAWAKFVRQWREKYEGVDNAGKTAIIRDTDASFTKVGLGLNELNMDVLQDMTESDILKMFKVPSALLGDVEESGLGRGNVETLDYIFAKRVTDKKQGKLDKTLQKLFDRFYKGEGLIVDHVSQIPGDKDYELAVRNQGVDRWISRNEIRGQDGLPDVDGGSDLRTLLNSIPIGEPEPPPDTSGASLRIRLTREAIPPKHTGTDDGAWDGPANEANLSNDAGKATYRKAYAWVDPDKDPDTKAAYKFIHHVVSSDGKVGSASVKGCTTGIAVLNGGRGGAKIPSGDKQGVYNHLAAHIKDAGDDPPELKAVKKIPGNAGHYQHALQSNWNKYAGIYGKKFNTLLRSQKSEVLGNLTSKTKFNRKKWEKDAVKALVPIVQSLVKDQGELAWNYAGGSKQIKDAEDSGFDESELDEPIRTATTKAIEGFDDETLAQLNAELNEGLAAGEGADQLADRVDSIYGSAMGYRSDRIARTEAIGASNDAAREAYIQTGNVTSIQWFANPDACDLCEEMDGTEVGTEENFLDQGESLTAGDSSMTADYDAIDNPPLHPNCECCILPVT